MHRIDFIAELTNGFDTLLDIGSDHGLVLKTALDKSYIKKGIASDLNQGPLDTAKKTLTGYPVEFYLSDGFKGIKSQFDIVTITGMGALLISDILKFAPEHVTFILGANDKQEVLRTYLVTHGFKIIDEYVVHDGFYYVFIKAIKGQMMLTNDEIYTGHHLKHKRESFAYFEYKVSVYQQIQSKAKGKRLEEISQILHYFEAALKVVSNL